MIFLIGMPASGKSYWARVISQEWRMTLADIDDLIAEQENASIADIFKQKGATYFRAQEQQILQHIIATYPSETIVACGGGTPVYNDNINLMKREGCVVYLDTDISILLQRLENDNSRPLIEGNGKRERLEALFTERQYIYKQAHYILPAKNLSLHTFAKIIEQCTDQR